MNHGYGIESHGEHRHTETTEPVRYLVIVDSAGMMLARLFLESREQVAEVDASTEEIVTMTRGLTPSFGATGVEWDQALLGHSAAERRAARVYTLDI
jgi:hypothetical protein